MQKMLKNHSRITEKSKMNVRSEHNYIGYVIFEVKNTGSCSALKPFDSNFWAVATMWQF